MTLEDYLDKSFHLDRAHQNLQSVFGAFCTDMVELFNGKSGPLGIRYIVFSIPETHKRNSFTATYLGRSFEGQFSTHINKDGTAIGKLALYELDIDTTHLKKCECHFSSKGDVIDIKSCDESRGDTIRIGHSRQDNAYLVVALLNMAVSDL